MARLSLKHPPLGASSHTIQFCIKSSVAAEQGNNDRDGPVAESHANCSSRSDADHARLFAPLLFGAAPPPSPTGSPQRIETQTSAR